MAVGDIINDIVVVLAASNVNFQPAAGVEIMLTQFGYRDVPSVNDMSYLLYDGVTNSRMQGNTSVPPSGELVVKMGINNTNYLFMFNADVASREFGYTGIQTQ